MKTEIKEVFIVVKSVNEFLYLPVVDASENRYCIYDDKKEAKKITDLMNRYSDTVTEPKDLPEKYKKMKEWNKEYRIMPFRYFIKDDEVFYDVNHGFGITYDFINDIKNH